MSLVIKVSYDGKLRRFTVPETARWADVSQQIAQLPGISALNGAYFVQYRDSDNDVVTISSDGELTDLIHATQGPNSNPTLRFEVVPQIGGREPTMHVLENEEAETEQVDGVAMETEQEQGEATQAPSEEADQARTNKDKHAAPQPDSFGNLFEQISGILSNFQGMFADKPEILAQVNEFASRILNVDGGQPQADVEAVKRHLEYWAAHIKQHLNNAQTGEGAPWWAKYANQWMAKYEAAQREASNAASEPTEPENGSSSTSALPGSFFDGERPFYPTRGGRSWGGPYGRGPWGPAWLHRGRSESPAPPMESFVPEQPQQTQPEASPEEIEEKVAQLNNMGFLGDDENLKEMLERYHGNVERVVELLVRG